MSYFEDNFTGDASDDDISKTSGSESDDDNLSEKYELEEDNLLGEDNEEYDEDDDVGGGVDAPSDDDADIVIEEKVKDYDEDGSDDEDDNEEPETIIKKIPSGSKIVTDLNDDDDDDDPTGEIYLEKFNKEINDNYLVNNHPESVSLNYDEIITMTKIVRDKNGIIIDDLHKTIPYLTKYEKSRILGQRAKQINSGATAFVKVPEKVIDGYLIAELELQEKRIPFIIRRPLPNGGSEYWKVNDLENISF